ncbi:MAG: PTS system mannose/fructose/sorbose family transporter subunit IID [Deltaproteobacteria bacterium]|nr:PTS system mannose/fructose/sorbose family transporter subunit IID [Deltaproteobacteria bacterium]MBN2671164.1 PTS system mannose/fructose/sorbose family transporter subunit IID [Deltaproteobacteria bacterium]
MNGNITNRDLLKVSARLALIQSAWTMSSMQSEGFVYCLSPALQKLFPEKKRLLRVVNHYHLPINTHPFLVSILAGAILKMESEKKSQREIASFLRNGGSGLAALGDSFFHAVLAFASVVAALLTLIWGSVAGVIALVLIYNSVHLLIRVSGIFIGFEKGDATLSEFGKWIDSDKTKALRTATAVVGGILMTLIFLITTSNLVDTWWIAPVSAITILSGFVLNLKRAFWVYVLPAFLFLVLILEVII